MTQKFRTLSDVVALAEFAHRNQVDKAGMPYFEHPKRVMEKVQAQGALPYVQMAAVLHDVTEDTAFTPEILITLGVPEGAVEIVSLVDRDYSRIKFASHYRFGIDFSNPKWKTLADEYYYACIKENTGALQVKVADIEDNLSSWRLTYLPEETQIRLRAKYAKALRLLGVVN